MTVAASGADGVGPGGQPAHREGGAGAVVLAHVEVAVAVEFDDPRQARRRGRWRAGRGGRRRRRGRRARASRRRRAAWRSRTRRSRRRSRGRGSRPAAAASRRTSSALDCAQSTRRVSQPVLCTVNSRCRKSAPASAVPTPGKRQAQGTGLAVGVEQLRPRGRRPGSSSSAAISAATAPGPQLGVLVQQQAVAPLRLAQQGRVVLRLAGPPLALDQPDLAAERAHRRRPSRRRRRCRGRGSRARPPPGACARSPPGRRAGTRGRSCSRRSRRAWAAQAVTIIALLESGPTFRMPKVQLVDPSAFTPPYDRALAAALARAGAEVELLTTEFLYGAVPAGGGLRGRGALLPPHRRARARRLAPASPSRRPSTCPTCCACAARLDADVVHYQWLTMPRARRLRCCRRRARG